MRDAFRLLCAGLGLFELAFRLCGAREALGKIRARMGLGLRRALPRLWRLGLLDLLGLLDFVVRVETIVGAFCFLYTSAEQLIEKIWALLYDLRMRTRIVPLHKPPCTLDFLQAKSTLEEPLPMKGLML